MKVPVIDSIPFKLYLDLDGVFADFNGRVKLLTGKIRMSLEKICGKLSVEIKNSLQVLN